MNLNYSKRDNTILSSYHSINLIKCYLVHSIYKKLRIAVKNKMY